VTLPVFSGCTGRTMRRLSNLGTRLHVHGGQRLITAGQTGAEVHIVISGIAACIVDGREVGQFGVGDFFGEVATLDGGPRTATVVALSEMDILVFNGAEFEILVKASPDVAHRMLKAMAHRLRQANAKAVA
jgi:CRP/FNR family cyclic AMP-dependent transcriptional regulator